MDIRAYQEGDYETHIKSLTKENMQQLFVDNFGGWSDEVSDKKFFNVLKEGVVKLFFLDNTFIGYVSFSAEKDHSDSYLIHDIHIVKEFQRKGYGKEILDYVVTEVTKLNGTQLKVFVFEENPAVNFYKKNGFEEYEHLKKSNTQVLTKKI